MQDESRQRPVLAVLGPGSASEAEMAVADQVGRLAGARGWVVLTGGGPGVMEAACRGACEAGGLTVGILPVARPGGGYPNPWVEIPVFTDVGMARNAINVLSARFCVAIGGGPGTLSEIALAMKAGVEVWCFRSWGLEPPPGGSFPAPRRFEDRNLLFRALEARLEE